MIFGVRRFHSWVDRDVDREEWLYPERKQDQKNKLRKTLEIGEPQRLVSGSLFPVTKRDSPR